MSATAQIIPINMNPRTNTDKAKVVTQEASPHDRFLRRCLSDRELAKGFFRRFLTAEKLEEIDIESLQLKQVSFASKALNANTTDMVFQASIRNRPGFLSLMVEHKSGATAYNDGHTLPFRLRFQEMMVMDYGQRMDPLKRYPLVFSLGLHRGDHAYSGPKTVSEDINAPEFMIPARWDESMDLIDLSRYSDSELMEEGKLGVFLLVLKYIHTTNMEQTLKLLEPQMDQIEEQQDNDFIVAVFRYLYEVLVLDTHQTADSLYNTAAIACS